MTAAGYTKPPRRRRLQVVVVLSYEQIPKLCDGLNESPCAARMPT